MSRVGNSLDNREAEHFFGTLKTEFYKVLQWKVNSEKFKLIKPKQIFWNLSFRWRTKTQLILWNKNIIGYNLKH